MLEAYHKVLHVTDHLKLIFDGSWNLEIEENWETLWITYLIASNLKAHLGTIC